MVNPPSTWPGSAAPRRATSDLEAIKQRAQPTTDGAGAVALTAHPLGDGDEYPLLLGGLEETGKIVVTGHAAQPALELLDDETEIVEGIVHPAQLAVNLRLPVGFDLTPPLETHTLPDLFHGPTHCAPSAQPWCMAQRRPGTPLRGTNTAERPMAARPERGTAGTRAGTATVRASLASDVDEGPRGTHMAWTTASPASVDRPSRLRMSSLDSTLMRPPDISRQCGAVRSPTSSSSGGNWTSSPDSGSSSSRRLHQAAERRS